MNEWNSAGVEKDFTIVHYADMLMIDNKRKYIIQLNSDGTSSAKTPPMFLENDEEFITNDYSIFINRIDKVLNTK